MSWNKFEREMDAGPTRATLAVWKWMLLVLVLGGITTCGVAFVIKPFQAASDTLDGDNVKYNYEWFKQTHEDVRALDVQIKTAQAAVDQFKIEAGSRDGWHREDREEFARLNAVLQGLKNQRADIAANYNARSRMVNRAIFKGTDTPEQIALEGDAK